MKFETSYLMYQLVTMLYLKYVFIWGGRVQFLAVNLG